MNKEFRALSPVMKNSPVLLFSKSKNETLPPTRKVEPIEICIIAEELPDAATVEAPAEGLPHFYDRPIFKSRRNDFL